MSAVKGGASEVWQRSQSTRQGLKDRVSKLLSLQTGAGGKGRPGWESPPRSRRVPLGAPVSSR